MIRLPPSSPGHCRVYRSVQPRRVCVGSGPRRPGMLIRPISGFFCRASSSLSCPLSRNTAIRSSRSFSVDHLLMRMSTTAFAPVAVVPMLTAQADRRSGSPAVCAPTGASARARIAPTAIAVATHTRANLMTVLLLRRRRQRVAVQRVRNVRDRLLRADAVARIVERRRDDGDPELAGRDGDETAADAALRGEPG